MNTIFQVAGVTFSKDLVFGWCVNLEGSWVTLAEINDTSLQYLSSRHYPVYVPDEFKQEVLSIIDCRKKQVNKKEEAQSVKIPPVTVPSEVSFDYTPYNHVGRIHTYLATRDVDASKLLMEILKKVVPVPMKASQTETGEYMSKSDLGYCVVSFDAKSGVTPYRIIAKDGKTYDCDDLAHVVEIILRKWW